MPIPAASCRSEPRPSQKNAAYMNDKANSGKSRRARAQCSRLLLVCANLRCIGLRLEGCAGICLQNIWRKNVPLRPKKNELMDLREHPSQPSHLATYGGPLLGTLPELKIRMPQSETYSRSHFGAYGF
jgi:hypothetical protein